MIHYRPFRNTDPPAIAEIWRSQPPLRGLAQPMSPLLLEQYVFAKSYFDHDGIIMAFEDQRPVGFVHAGFGPNEDSSALSAELGVTCVLMVIPHDQENEIADELLARSETYLRARGSTALFGGCIDPLTPFYLGLYGGSGLPGVLASDKRTVAVFERNGYQPIDGCVMLQRDLAGFRPIVDRKQMRIRRANTIEATFDPFVANWWDACTVGQIERTQFQLWPRNGGVVSGEATYWDLEPLASSWGVHAVGLQQLEINESLRRQGLATYLVGESLRQFASHGAALAVVQARQDNHAALGLFAKLGFQEIDQGIAFHKETG